MNSTQTLTARLKTLFTANPGRWLDGRELARVAGFAGWRSRVSDLRRGGMDIRNRQRRFRGSDGVRYTVTEYLFEPAGIHAQERAS